MMADSGGDGEGRLERVLLLLGRICDYWMQTSGCHDELIS